MDLLPERLPWIGSEIMKRCPALCQNLLYLVTPGGGAAVKKPLRINIMLSLNGKLVVISIPLIACNLCKRLCYPCLDIKVIQCIPKRVYADTLASPNFNKGIGAGGCDFMDLLFYPGICRKDNIRIFTCGGHYNISMDYHIDSLINIKE